MRCVVVIERFCTCRSFFFLLPERRILSLFFVVSEETHTVTPFAKGCLNEIL